MILIKLGKESFGLRERSSEKGFLLYASLGTLLVLLVIIFAFFTAYNRFLVDRSVSLLENSLSQVAYAQTMEDMRSLKFFLDELLMSELSEKSFDAKRLAGLEFSKSIAFEAKDFRQIREVRMILEDVLENRQKKQKPWEQWINIATQTMRKWFGKSRKMTEYEALMQKGREFTEEEKALYDEAHQCDERWDLSRAIELYEKLIREGKDCREILYVKFDLAYAYVKAGMFDRAKMLLLRLKRENEGTKAEQIAGVLFLNVDERIALKDTLARLLEKIKEVKNARDLQQIYFETALLQYKLFELNEAETAFRNSVTVLPNTEQAMKSLFYLGLTLKFHAKYDEAITVFQELVERFPDSPFAVYGRYQLADSFHKIGNYEKASEEFENLAFAFPESDLAMLSQFRVGYTYYYDLGNPVLAAKAFDKLSETFSSGSFSEYSQLEISPLIRSGFVDYGFDLLKRGLFAEAKGAFEDAIQADSRDAWAYSGLATALVLVGEKELALKRAGQAVEIQPDEYTIGAQGYVRELGNDYAGALLDYKKSLTIRRNYPAVLYNLARLQEVLGHYDAAIRYYRELIDLHVQNVEQSRQMPEAFNNLGYALWYKGKF